MKERASEEGRDALVALDVAPARGPRPPSWDAAFERSVSEAAGLALQLLARGNRAGLLLGDALVPPEHRTRAPARPPARARARRGVRPAGCAPRAARERRRLPRRAGPPETGRVKRIPETAKAALPLPFLRERVLAVGSLALLAPVPLFFANALELARPPRLRARARASSWRAPAPAPSRGSRTRS